MRRNGKTGAAPLLFFIITLALAYFVSQELVRHLDRGGATPLSEVLGKS